MSNGVDRVSFAVAPAMARRLASGDADTMKRRLESTEQVEMMGKKRTAMLLSLIAVALAIGWISIRGRGFSARERPSAVEKVLARAARRLALPAGAAELPNPVSVSPGVLESALEHFADHCAVCHANDGSGDTAIGRNLYPKAPDMRRDETQSLTDGELFYVISNGVRLNGMPAWGNGRSDEDMESGNLVHFIRHLPDISGSELAQMKGWNPMSPRECAQRTAEAEFVLHGAPRARAADGHH